MPPLFKKKEAGKSEKKEESPILRNFKNILEDAKEYEKEGNIEKAKLHYRRLLRSAEDIIKPGMDKKIIEDISNYLVEAGKRIYVIDNPDKAVEFFEKAKEMNVANADAWLFIGKTLISKNRQIPYAMLCLKEATRYSPENAEGWALLGDSYRLQNQNEKAIEAYTKAIELNPEEMEYYDKLLKVDPNNVEILKKKASILQKKDVNNEEIVGIYARLASIEGDIKYVEEGLEIEPDNALLLMQKAKILVSNGENEKALELLKELNSKYPDNIDVKVLLEEVESKVGSEDKQEEEEPTVGVEDIFGDIDLATEDNIAKEDTALDFGEPAVDASEEVVIQEPPLAEPEKEVVVEQPENVQVAQEEKTIQEPAEETVVEVPEQPVQEIKAETPAEPEVKEEPTVAPEAEEVSVEPNVEPPAVEESVVEAVPEAEPTAVEVVEETVVEDKISIESMSEEEKLAYVDELVKNKKHSDALAVLDTMEGLNIDMKKAEVLIDSGELDDADKIITDVLRRDMKNPHAMYFKALIMANKDNEMGARNFIMMSVKFDPAMKDRINQGVLKDKYGDKEWFKKMVS